MRLSAMGDVAMTVPVVASLAEQNHDLKITFISNPRFEDMFCGIKNVRFLGIDTKKKYVGLKGIFKLFKELKKENFDAVIDIHDVLRSKFLRLLFRLNGTPVFKIDKGRKEKKELVKRERKRFNRLKTSVSRYKEVFERAGFNFQLNFDGLFKKDAELSESIKKGLFDKKEQWLAIAPFAQHAGKIYPLEMMKKLVEHFSNEPEIKILLFGGGEREKSVLESWATEFQNTYSLAGKFKLKEELEILNKSEVLVSMDSANMHLASLTGTPVVSVWGATHPYAGFYGYNQEECDIVQIDMPCRPCSIYGNKPCIKQNYECLNNISTDMIINKLRRYLR